MIRKKLFLASSSELKDDRQDFEIFINRKNGDWVNRGVFLDLVKWEDFLDAVSKTRLQDEYNKAIRESDIFVMLFFTKVGQYTEEEFETAFGQFQATHKPFIFTYFKDAEISTGSASKKDLISLLTFQEKLDGLRHFYTRYKNTDELLFHFNRQLDKLADGGFIELKLDTENNFVRPGKDNEAAYRDWLAKRCEKISLSGLDLEADDARSRGAKTLGLEQVYVDLDTETTAPEQGVKDALAAGLPLQKLPSAKSTEDKSRPIAAWESAALFSRLVLLGAPGSGKSTFVNRLCLALLRGDWKTFSGWPERWRKLHSVLVVLRDFARWLAVSPDLAAQRLRKAITDDPDCQYPDPHMAEPERTEKMRVAEEKRRKFAQGQGNAALRAYLMDELDKADLGGCRDYLLSALDGEALVCFDGLDEAPPEQRPIVLGCLLGFSAANSGCRLLVTCRVASYQRPEWRLPDDDFPEFTLAEFDDEKIGHFIDAWYGEMARFRGDTPEDTSRSIAKLREALQRRDLARLKHNPLLLTVIALVHTHKRELPDHRAQLYKECVEILLWEWEKRKLGAGEPALLRLLRQAGLGRAHLLRVLRELAFKVHAAAGAEVEQAADIGESDLVGAFTRLRGPRPDADAYKWAKEVVDALGERSGLLVERRPGVFAFPHRTFQEYLAGVELTEGNFVTKAAEKAGEGDYWREAILLAVGHLVHNEAKDELAAFLADKLCPEAVPEDDATWRKTHLAGEVLLEMGLANVVRAEDGKVRANRVRRQLLALLEGGRLNPIERAVAGESLGALGDPRFDPNLYFLPCQYRGEDEPLLGFVEIPAGPFWMGSERGVKGASKNEFGNENPLEISYAFWIARYPVTVAQFGAFIADGGYEDAAFWKYDAAGRWLKAEPRTGPSGWDGQRLHPNRPVSYMTCYEAMAYCVWLHAKLRDKGLLPEGHIIRLPSEAEWEKAARWRLGAPSPLCYPWGNLDWTPERANIADSGIGHPTPVGMYPEGATASGLHDLAGNVWEWTRTGYGAYPYDPQRNGPQADYRVVRGGSWNSDSDRARCAYRGRHGPDSDWYSNGFRVVLSIASFRQEVLLFPCRASKACPSRRQDVARERSQPVSLLVAPLVQGPAKYTTTPSPALHGSGYF